MNSRLPMFVLLTLELLTAQRRKGTHDRLSRPRRGLKHKPRKEGLFCGFREGPARGVRVHAPAASWPTRSFAHPDVTLHACHRVRHEDNKNGWPKSSRTDRDPAAAAHAELARRVGASCDGLVTDLRLHAVDEVRSAQGQRRPPCASRRSPARMRARCTPRTWARGGCTGAWSSPRFQSGSEPPSTSRRITLTGTAGKCRLRRSMS